MKWQVWVRFFEAPGWYLLCAAIKVDFKRTCLLHKNGELQESKRCLWTVRRHLCALCRCGLFLELCSFLPNHCCVAFRRCLYFHLHALSCVKCWERLKTTAVCWQHHRISASDLRHGYWLDLMLVQLNISSTSSSSCLSGFPVLCFWDHFGCKCCNFKRQTLLSEDFSSSILSTGSTWNHNQVLQPAGQQRDS